MRTKILLIATVLLSTFLYSQTDWSRLNNQWFRANATGITAGSRTASTDTLYIADSDSLHKSTNSGTTWITTSEGIASPLAVACNYRRPNEVVVGTSKKLRYSSDGGADFDDKLTTTNNDPTCITFSRADTNYVYAGFTAVAANDACLYRSTNGGVDWSAVASFYDPNNSFFTNVRQVAVLENDNNFVYVGGETSTYTPSGGDIRQGLFFSMDGGTTFTNANLTASTDDITAVGAYDSIYNGSYTGIRSVYVGYRNGTLKHHKHSTGTVLTTGAWGTISLTGSPGVIYNIQTSHDTVYITTDIGIYIKYGGAWNNTFTRVTSGMYGISLRALAIGGNNSGKLYTAGDSAAYISTNFGSSWSEITDELNAISVNSVSTLGCKRVSASETFYTVGVTQCATTTNKMLYDGATIKQFSGKHVFINPKDTTYWFAAGTDEGDNKPKLYRSTDNGSTWKTVLKPNIASASFTGTVVDPKNEQTVYAYGKGNATGNYFYSTSSGDTNSYTQVKVDAGTNYIYSMAIDSTGALTAQSKIGYAATAYSSANGGIWKSTDMHLGSSSMWTQWSGIPGTGNPQDRSMYAVALNPKCPNMIYAGGATKPASDDYGMWKSTNKGTNWSRISNINDTVRAIVMDPRWSRDSNYVFILIRDGATNKIQRTTDGGSTWTDVTGSLPTPIYDIRTDPTDTLALYAATAKGVFKAQKVGTPSLTSPSNSASIGYKCPIPSLSWGSVTDATSYRLLLDTSSSFTSPGLKDTTTSATSYTIYNVIKNKTYYWKVYAIGFFGEGGWSETRTFTTDGVASTSPDAWKPSWNATELMTCSTALIWFNEPCLADSIRIQVTSDSTLANPDKVNAKVPIGRYLYTVTNLSPNTKYYYRLAANVANNTGPFTIWIPFTTWAGTSAPNTPDTLYPANGTTEVCRNGGVWWNDVPGPTIDTIHISTSPSFTDTVRFAAVNVRWAEGSGYTFDPPLSGSTWYYYKVRASNCYGASSWSASSSFRTKASICEGGDTKTALLNLPKEKQIPSDFSLFQNHPNPFNPTTEISYALPEDQHVVLKVYNTLGAEVATLVDSYQSAGYKTAYFDATKLSSGIYFYRIQAGTFSDVKKMLLMK